MTEDTLILEKQKLNDLYLSSNMSTSEQISSYIEEFKNNFSVETLSAKDGIITNLSSSIISCNDEIYTDNFLVGQTNIRHGNQSFASGLDNIAGAKGFYFGAMELSNDSHPDEIYIYLKKDQPQYDERCSAAFEYDSNKSKHGPYGRDPRYDSPIISTDVSGTKLSSNLIAKDEDVFNYMQENYASDSDISGILLNVVNATKQAFRRIKTLGYATISNEIRYDVLRCKQTDNLYLFDSYKDVACFSTIPYDFDDYSVVFCEHPEIGLNEDVSKNSFAVGTKNKSMGRETAAIGKENYVEGNYATAIGRGNKVYGYIGFASGRNCVAGISAAVGIMHAEGQETSALGYYSHSEGYKTLASGNRSHAEGDATKAQGQSAHAEGQSTTAFGNYSHAEGHKTYTENIGAHAEGNATSAIGDYSHAEGTSTYTANIGAHAEGSNTTASGQYNHAEGHKTYTKNYYSHAEGNATSAIGQQSHAEGTYTLANGESSHAEGLSTYTDISSKYSHAEGHATSAVGWYSHAEGYKTFVSCNYSHAEGNETSAIGFYSHAEGRKTFISGNYSHAEGEYTVVKSTGSHAEGNYTSAFSIYSHAEGISSVANAKGSHAEGNATYTGGWYSHAEGNATSAIGNWSHAEGAQTQTLAECSHAAGRRAVVEEGHNYAYVWNGLDSKKYSSNGKGSFNINPLSGLSGFYIGKNDFISCVINALSSLDTYQKTALGNIITEVLNNNN